MLYSLHQMLGLTLLLLAGPNAENYVFKYQNLYLGQSVVL